ncbi:MAG: hypothetical protein ACKOS8_00005, partial [Gemmataceae bacterium]
MRISGSISIIGASLGSANGKVEGGDWNLVPGIVMHLSGLAFEYNSQDEKYRLFGSCEATLMGGTVGVNVAEPGIVWRKGSFESFGGGLTGSLGMDLDGNNHLDFTLAIDKMGFLFEVNPWRVTLTGGGLLVYNGLVMAGGGVSTDERGIIFGATGLEHLSFRGKLVLSFGENFEDTNHNFIRDTNEKFEDRNKDGRYTAGIGIVIANAGISYTGASPTKSARLKLTGMGRLAFEVGNLAEYPDVGTFVDLSKDGIEIADGRLETFSLIVGANLRIVGVEFQPEGSAGMRYLAERDQLDL